MRTFLLVLRNLVLHSETRQFRTHGNIAFLISHRLNGPFDGMLRVTDMKNGRWAINNGNVARLHTTK